MQKTLKDINRDLLNTYCDVNTLAFFMNCTPRRVQQLVRQGVIAKGDKRGEYEPISCLHSYQNHLKRLISHFAGYYAGKGNKAELKQKDRVERRIYRTAAVDLKAAPTNSEADLIVDLIQLTFFPNSHEAPGEDRG